MDRNDRVGRAGGGAATGLVTFTDGKTPLGTGKLGANGTATLCTSTLTTPLAVGTHTIKATYAGDQNFTASSSVLTQQVMLSTTTTTITASASPSVFGQSVTFTATVGSAVSGVGVPTGTVTFKDGTATLGTGKLDATGTATFTTAKLTVGTHAITAAYGGDTRYLAGTSGTTQTVGQDATTIALAASASPSVFGQSITFTAIASAAAPGAGVPTGTVTFWDGATTLGTGRLDATGKATFKTAALAVASHTIAASYAGDTHFLAGSDSIAQTVAQAATTTALSVSLKSSVFGQSLTFTAQVKAAAPGAGAPSGTVTFAADGTTLATVSVNATGKATLPTAALAAGAHAITATYNGDANFTTSGGSLSQTVSQAATTIAVTASPKAVVFGQRVTFTAVVKAKSPGAGVPSGSVIFTIGNTTVTLPLDATGTASVSTSALNIGSNTIRVSYSGDTNFTVSTSTYAQTVGKAATRVAVSGLPTSAAAGQLVAITATVMATSPGGGVPGGTVTFKDGAKTLGTATLDASGTATLSTSVLAVGLHTITVSYGGSADFTASSGSASEQVGPAVSKSVATSVTSRIQDAALLALLSESGRE